MTLVRHIVGNIRKSNSIEKALKQHTKLEAFDQDNSGVVVLVKSLYRQPSNSSIAACLLSLCTFKEISPYGDKISKRVEYPKELNMKLSPQQR